jgi:folate-binding protein YgfZ
MKLVDALGAAAAEELTRSGAVVFLATDRAAIEVRGDDRFRWLNAVVSADIAQLESRAKPGAPAASYACILSVKGKLLADAWVVSDGERLTAFVPAATADEITALWDAHIVMEDVELARDDGRRLLFVQGHDAAAIVAKAAEAGALGATSGFCEADAVGLGAGVLTTLTGEAEPAVATLSAAGATAVSESAWAELHVRRGRPRFGDDFDASHYVQEAGLQTRAVSFTKGCYLGQEVVCMLQNRGKVQRRLVSLAVSGAAARGDQLWVDGKAVGQLTSVASEAAGGAVAIGMVKAAASTPGAKLSLGEGRGEATVVSEVS